MYMYSVRVAEQRRNTYQEYLLLYTQGNAYTCTCVHVLYILGWKVLWNCAINSNLTAVIRIKTAQFTAQNRQDCSQYRLIPLA